MKNIPKPSSKQIRLYLKSWKKDERYFLSEDCLNNLFLQTYPKNLKLEEVLTKVCTLDVMYSAGASRWFFEVSENIKKLNIDEKLEKGDLEVVNLIAKINTTKRKERNLYSFATKYCNHHRPEHYPIYDSYVEKTLSHFNKYNGKFIDYPIKELKNYKFFKETILKFRDFYNLREFTLREIDIYLWLLGKKYFPNNYLRKKVNNSG